MRRVGTGPQRPQDGWAEHVSHQKVKVHVELNPAALEDILDDCNVDPSARTIDTDYIDNDIVEGEVKKIVSGSYNEEEWESNDISSSTSDDDFTIDHVMQKWGVD